MDRNHQVSGINSRENARESFETLLIQLENQLSSVSSGGGKTRPSKEAINETNSLKMYRKKLKDAIALIDNMDEEQWMKNRDEIRPIFEEANKKIDGLAKAV